MQNTEEKAIGMDEETKYLLDFIHQWEEKHPDEEMVFITLPKHDLEERKRILQTAIKILGEESTVSIEKIDSQGALENDKKFRQGTISCLSDRI